MVMLLWASKIATAKVEWSLEMGKWTLLRLSFLLLVILQTVLIILYYFAYGSNKTNDTLI